MGARYVRASIDDLYIILRFVENAATGRGLVFNIGERVEGYTCFGWVLILTGLVRVGWPAYWASKFIGLLCAMVSLKVVYLIGREFWHGYKHSWLTAFVPVILLAVNPDFLYWSVAGLETSLFVCLVFIIFYLIVLETRLARESNYARWLVSLAQAAACSLAILVRPEGVVLLAYALFAKILMWRTKHEWFPHCMLLGISSVIPVTAFFLWRHSYYGAWLPNTYYAKVGGGLLDRLASGKHYLFECLADSAFGSLGDSGATAWPGLILLLALPILAAPFVRRKRGHGIILGGALMFTAISVWEGGDWMPHNRFLVPVVGCWMLLLTHSVAEIALWSLQRSKPYARYLMVAAICVTLVLFADYIRLNTSHPVVRPLDRNDSWPVVLSRHILLTSPEGTLASSDIGLIGYITKYRVIDIAGLIDTHIARSPGNSFQKDYDVSYILDQSPDFIILIDQRCLPEDRIRKHPAFINDYKFIVKHGGHSLYGRKRI